LIYQTKSSELRFMCNIGTEKPILGSNNNLHVCMYVCNPSNQSGSGGCGADCDYYLPRELPCEKVGDACLGVKITDFGLTLGYLE